MKNAILWDVMQSGSSGMLCHVALVRKATWHNIPEDSILHQHENLRSYMDIFMFHMLDIYKANVADVRAPKASPLIGCKSILCLSAAL
jgi:hypothetical protein